MFRAKSNPTDQVRWFLVDPFEIENTINVVFELSHAVPSVQVLFAMTGSCHLHHVLHTGAVGKLDQLP